MALKNQELSNIILKQSWKHRISKPVELNEKRLKMEMYSSNFLHYKTEKTKNNSITIYFKTPEKQIGHR